jgi:hypothetical protein
MAWGMGVRAVKRAVRAKLTMKAKAAAISRAHAKAARVQAVKTRVHLAAAKASQRKAAVHAAKSVRAKALLYR